MPHCGRHDNLITLISCICYVYLQWKKIYYNLSLLLNNSTEYTFFLEKRTDNDLHKTFLTFYVPERSLSSSQQTVPCPYPRHFNPALTHTSHLRSILILFSHLLLSLLSSLFPLGFRNKT